MPRFYFDMRDADGVVPDEEGMELGTMKAVQQEAAQALAHMARDAMNIPTWSDSDVERLKVLVASGASAVRASVALKRGLAVTENKAREVGIPFR